MSGGSEQPKSRNKISARVVSYFLLVAVVPPAIVAVVLLGGARNQLFHEASVKQQAYVTSASQHVDNYIDANTSQLAFTAKLYAGNPNDIDQSLIALFTENSSLIKVEVLTKDGKKRTATKQLKDVKIAVTKIESDNNALDLLGDRSRLLTLTRDLSDTPQVAVSVPIRNDPEGNTPSRIIGGIIGHYRVGNVWKSVLPPQQDTDAYAYVVDEYGNLAYHPDQAILAAHDDLKNVAAVQNFMVNNPKTVQTTSITKKDVLSAARSTKSGWGVIVEEPTSSIYAGVHSYTQLSLAVVIGTIAVSIVVALSFSGRIVRPIKKLVVGARRLAQNDFTQKIEIKTKDELQELAEIFNDLGINISNFVNNLQANNRDLNDEQSRLQSIINSVNDGVIAINAKQEIISLNPSAAKLLIDTSHPAVGKPLNEVFPWTRDGNALQMEIEYPGVRSYDNVILAKSESVSYLDLMVEVLDRADDNVAAIITIHNQTSTRELNFMKLDFVAIAAHELRTPLSVISGYLDMLEREAIKELSNENIENLKSAIVGAGQLRELINKLLNIARIERGDMEIFLDKIDLAQLVAKNVKEHQPVATQRSHTLSFVASTSDPIYVPADTASIVEVLNNLIGNAIKYTPDGGQIQVSITTTDDQARVEVSDNGPGVPGELRDKLFSKFYRAERNMIAHTRGTGLGLFISKTVIELQHGTIGIAPDQGRGSTFYFTLPIYNPQRDDELIQKNVSRGKHGWYKKSPNS